MILSSMTREIKDNIGNMMSQETEDLLSNFSGNFEKIDCKFDSLQQTIDRLNIDVKELKNKVDELNIKLDVKFAEAKVANQAHQDQLNQNTDQIVKTLENI